jgi:hypothetical protein
MVNTKKYDKITPEKEFVMKQPIDIDATIKSAFNAMIKIISNKIEKTKDKKTKQEYAKLQRDMDLLREVASNPRRFFQINDGPNDKYTLMDNLLDISVLSVYYSPQQLQGTRLLDSLILYTADYYQDKVQKYDTKDCILELNKIIQLKSATGVVRALEAFRSIAPAERFAVHENEK